jgi:hypothetical protein
MAKRGTEKLEQISITLPPEVRAFHERAAEHDSRSLSGQIRHLCVEAARRNGSPALTPWPPPMALPASLDEAREELTELGNELDRLKAFQKKGGAFGAGLLPHQDERFRFLRDRVKNLELFVEQRERMEDAR